MLECDLKFIAGLKSENINLMVFLFLYDLVHLNSNAKASEAVLP